jgi:hypothetical protein
MSIPKKELYLSASRIKTLTSCSWLYHVQYVLGLRSPGNFGSIRGTICHLVFESLLNTRHKKHYNHIIKHKKVFNNKVLSRYLALLCAKHGLEDSHDNKGQHNLEMIEEMIIVGVSTDFFCKGWKLDKAETEIKIETPTYQLLGYIDKLAEKDGKMKIMDYKSSAKKDDHSLQAMCYALWAKRVKRMDSIAEFIYLRFPEDSISKYEFSDTQLDGFEQYLESLYSQISNFSIDSAVSNFAADQDYPSDGGFGGPLMCGRARTPDDLKKDGTPAYRCAFKFAFEYYSALDEKGHVLGNFMNEKDAERLAYAHNGKVNPVQYLGCPRWNGGKTGFEEDIW